MLKRLGFVFSYARKYVLYLAVTVVVMVLLVAVQLISPQIIRTLISAVSEGTWDASSARLITTLTGSLLVIYILRMGLAFLRSYMAHKAGWGVVADARRQIYTHLQRLSLRFYEDQQTGQLMSRMVNDSDYFEQLIAHAVPDTIVNILTLVGVSIVLTSMNWQLMLLTLIPIPLVVIAMRMYAKKVHPAFRSRQKELAELNAQLNENLSGIREIKAFTREDSEAQRIGTNIDRYRDSNLSALKLMATFGPFIEFASSLGTLVVIYFGGKLAFQKVLPIADLVAYFLYLEMFYAPVRSLSAAWESMLQALAGADRVAELLNEQPDVDDRPNARPLPERAKGDIEFKDVSFRYSKGENVLEHINLHIQAGQVVALVGPTGVGKTTMASLLPRFYDVSEGTITLDGLDVRDITLKSLREQISIVLQNVFLFHGTVRDNIAFGREGATEEMITNAAQVANAHEFILKLPEGYDTLIGERGVKLSGGQKQRLAIARAVLRDSPILVLDEATSSVDTETELLIQQALDRLIANRTTIIIAHRLSTIRNADVIVVLEGRHIAEMGTHEQLMAADGLYRHLVEVQNHLDPNARLLQSQSLIAENAG
ncbi:MAG: ABC transporter ATP-binding protein/permease [Chloroflexi bacterium]|nr:ABC transporter ATP-binding protein/permease [Chloroflexota bacterium]